jgi:hypothetical protein
MRSAMNDLSYRAPRTPLRVFVFLVLLCSIWLGGCSSSDESAVIVDPPGDEILGEAPMPTLDAAPDYATGTEFSLAWTVPDDTTDLHYQAQRATDPEFTIDLEISEWTAATSYTFADLTDGVTYFYRIRSQLSDGRSSDFSAAVHATQDASLPSAQLGELAADQTSLHFDLSFAASDLGSGVAAVEIWVRRNALVFRHYGTFSESPVPFVAEQGGPHSFYAVAIDSAGNRQPTPVDPQRTTQVPDAVILVDGEGFEWDITHAVYRYGLQVVHWGQGLGRGAIPPVIEPDMVGFGEVGFPDLENIALVIGMTVDGEARAYKQGDLNNREVVDVVVTGAHLAVTY